ncbi:hypothetical protein [Microbulbifer spongiae]|uniref:Lipocalin-like domain-containing protein n=1 Tax=Microbulbifer spongiae TaxID=2944933 RepID=A0ABY9EC59_9GAMM|nr:hypothetical protein [Microbulbifer sp. MI-G]WKD50050.1 hypothetical protein M8T91_01080 [Microbulbifer sp. MI-G]
MNIIKLLFSLLILVGSANAYPPERSIVFLHQVTREHLQWVSVSEQGGSAHLKIIDNTFCKINNHNCQSGASVAKELMITTGEFLALWELVNSQEMVVYRVDVSNQALVSSSFHGVMVGSGNTLDFTLRIPVDELKSKAANKLVVWFTRFAAATT